MNGQERMLTAVKGGTPDRVPVWELIVDEPVIKALYGDISFNDFCEQEGLDGVTIFEDTRMDHWIDDTNCVDEWGITWGVEPSGLTYPAGHPIEDPADLDDWQPPDPDAEYRFNSLREAVDRFKGEKAVTFLGHDVYEYSHYLRGMENLLMDYALRPELAHRMARMICDYKKQVIRNACEIGADIVLTGDDYAARKGPMMSPAHFREFILPYLTEIVEEAHSHDVPFIKHTDGNLWPIMDDLVDAGIDCLDPLEPIANMDIGEVKEKYGDRIALAGNVDCGQLLCFGTKDEVREAVKETIAKGSPGGGHILASSNSIHPAVDPENYRVMVETAREWGAYPLDEDFVAEYRAKDYMARDRDKSPEGHHLV